MEKYKINEMIKKENEFNKQLDEKDKEIKKLNEDIEKFIEFAFNYELVFIQITSVDKIIKFNKIWNINDKFSDIEELIYQKYPEYKNSVNYFILGGKTIDTKKTLKENNFKRSNHIIFNTMEATMSNFYKKENKQK